jgi:hypothetical protein
VVLGVSALQLIGQPVEILLLADLRQCTAGLQGKIVLGRTQNGL